MFGQGNNSSRFASKQNNTNTQSSIFGSNNQQGAPR